MIRPVSVAQIERHQREAAAVGDHVAVAACDIALGHGVDLCMLGDDDRRARESLDVDPADGGDERARALVGGWIDEAARHA